MERATIGVVLREWVSVNHLNMSLPLRCRACKTLGLANPADSPVLNIQANIQYDTMNEARHGYFIGTMGTEFVSDKSSPEEIGTYLVNFSNALCLVGNLEKEYFDTVIFKVRLGHLDDNPNTNTFTSRVSNKLVRSPDDVPICLRTDGGDIRLCTLVITDTCSGTLGTVALVLPRTDGPEASPVTRWARAVHEVCHKLWVVWLTMGGKWRKEVPDVIICDKCNSEDTGIGMLDQIADVS